MEGGYFSRIYLKFILWTITLTMEVSGLIIIINRERRKVIFNLIQCKFRGM